MLKHPRPHFGTDGVRGTYGKNISDEYAYVLGRALPQVLGADVEYVIGRDTRRSGQALTNALAAGLKDQRATYKNFGIITTPGIVVIARHTHSYCCVVTASHNPAEDNGIKVFDLGGTKANEDVERKIEETITRLLSEDVDELYLPVNADEEISGLGASMYIETLRELSDVQSLQGLKVVLDCANGAAYGIAPTIFQMFNAEVIAINTESDGLNINKNCGATHLDSLVHKVLETKSDIGFAFDGDADRLMIVDNEGIVKNGDDILALFALELQDKNLLKNNCVVATSMSNGALKKLLYQRNIKFVETQVGDKYVFQAMNDYDAVLGGEQSGHIIRKDIIPWGDGILNALLVAKIFVEKRQEEINLLSSHFLNLFTPMAQVHSKVTVTNKTQALNNEELSKAVDQELQLLGESARIIVRPSGTEEVVRISVEANNVVQAEKTVETIEKIVQEICG